MKKIWMMLLMVSAMFAFTACSDDDEKVPQNPVSNVTITSPVEIGKELVISGTGFTQEAEFYFTNEEGKNSESIKGDVNNSGVTLSVPMNMAPGKYTLTLKQGGNDWKLGEVTLTAASLPVENLKLPANAWINRPFVIEGTGFNETSKVSLRQEGIEAIDLVVTDYSAGLTCEIPTTVKSETYTIVLEQNGGEWTLGEMAFGIAPKRLVKIITESSLVANYTEEELLAAYEQQKSLDERIAEYYASIGSDTIIHITTEEEYRVKIEQAIKNGNYTRTTELVYEGDLLISIKQDGIEQITFSYSGNQIIGTNHTYSENFTLNIENEKVTSHEEESSIYSWNYSSDGYWETLIDNEDGYEIYEFSYEDNNLLGLYGMEFMYNEPEWKNPTNSLDITMFIYGELMYFDETISSAILLGKTGTHSSNLPSHTINSMFSDYLPINYQWDDNKEFVTSVNVEDENTVTSTGQLPAKSSKTYSFEYE